MRSPPHWVCGLSVTEQHGTPLRAGLPRRRLDASPPARQEMMDAAPRGFRSRNSPNGESGRDGSINSICAGEVHIRGEPHRPCCSLSFRSPTD